MRAIFGRAVRGILLALTLATAPALLIAQDEPAVAPVQGSTAMLTSADMRAGTRRSKQHPVHQQRWNRKRVISETGERKQAFGLLADHYRRKAAQTQKNAR